MTQQPPNPMNPPAPKEPAPAQEPAEPSFVTKEEYAQGLQKIERTVQHIVDGSYNRIDKNLKVALEGIDKLAGLAKAQGVDLTPDKITAMKTAAIQEALTAAPEGTPQGPDQQQMQPQAMNPVDFLARTLVAQAGFDISPDDPEYRTIDQDTRDPVEFLASVKQALAAKGQRIQNPGLPMAAAPSGQVNNSLPPSPTPTADSVAEELNKLLQHPRTETLPRIRELQNKLRTLSSS